MKKVLTLVLLAVSALGTAQTVKQSPTVPAESIVTVSARGHDVRQVLTDIFLQAKRSCVIQRNVECPLYLSLSETPFDKALDIVCQQSGLVADLKDGIYFIHRPAAKTTSVKILPKPRIAVRVVVAPPQIQRLSPSVLARRVTIRLAKAPINQVIETFSQETGTKIELDRQVPAYKLDAFLINTSLKYALDQVTKAAGLVYRFTDHDSILISMEESKVALAQ